MGIVSASTTEQNTTFRAGVFLGFGWGRALDSGCMESLGLPLLFLFVIPAGDLLFVWSATAVGAPFIARLLAR
jgi:hypothetical protein